MKTKLTHVLAWLMTLTMTANAQITKQFESATKITLNSTGYIKEMDNVAGYYALYRFDKADKTNDMYKLELMDDNCNSVKTVDIIEQRNSRLLEMVFNGKAFVLTFYHPNKREMQFLTYDKSGKKLGSKVFDDLSRMELMRIDQQLKSDEETGNVTIFPLSENGFVQMSMLKNDKYGYILNGYDNTFKQIWKFGSDPNSEMIEMADIVYSSSKYVVANVVKKKNLMSGNGDGFLIAIDATNGKKIFEYPLKEKSSEMSAINVLVNEAEGKFQVVGEYYAPGEDMLKSKSKGMYVLVLNASGQKQILSNISWDGDVKKVIKGQMDEDDKDELPRVFVHSVYQSPDGGIVAIGEQYKKTVSGLGVAGAVLSKGQSGASQMTIKNMVVMEFDKDFKIKNYQVIEKKKTRCPLPAGAGYLSSAALAMYIKSLGGFDFKFASTDNRNRYFAIFQDSDRKQSDGEKADLMLGVIMYEDVKISTNKFAINSTATNIWIHPAKPGYVNIVEYYKKKKTLTSRIEKVNYL